MTSRISLDEPASGNLATYERWESMPPEIVNLKDFGVVMIERSRLTMC